MLMRVLRITTLILTIVTAALFSVTFVTSTITKDRTIPEINVPDTMLEISVSATEEDLLKDVTATDAKDGDISERLLVESISRFSKTGYCKITYAACDYDNHVVTASRQIHYTDYTPPKFTLNRSPIFSIYNELDTNGLIGATDCLDGNISQNVIIYSPDFKEDEEGTFTIQATVTNSKGDTSEIGIPIVVEKMSRGGPTINLKTYLIYLKKGSTVPNWNEYVKECLDSSGLETTLKITTNTNLDPAKPGIYMVNYFGTEALENTTQTPLTAHTAMIVVVE